MGVLYKALSEEERAKYDALNSEDKLRFEKEMAAYKANKKAAVIVMSLMGTRRLTVTVTATTLMAVIPIRLYSDETQ